jgi:hypothetical protein
MGDRASYRIGKVARTSWWKFLLGAVLSAGVGFYLFNRSQIPMGRTAMADADAKQSTRAKTAFEPTDWNLAPIAAIYVGILVLLVVSCLAMIIAYPASLPDVSRTLRINPPGPRLQTNDEADLRRFRKEEDRKLNSYYWADKQKGVVHIPIGEAMQKLSRSGIDGFPRAQP